MYFYTALDESKNEIRLLQLLPGVLGDDIHCTLRHAELRAGLEYTALSYTWGSPTPQRTIWMDGLAFGVTPNLFDALQHMRETKEIGTWWCDAVCINQQDVEERNRQVLRMRDIYAIASCVQVWLGNTENDHDEAAMDLVQRLGSIIDDPEEALSQGYGTAYQERFLEELEACTPTVLNSLSKLFKRPWWTRVWVVQELALARQHMAMVRCGTKTVAWCDFLITAYALQISWFVVDAIISSKFPDERLDAYNQGIRMSQCRRVDSSHPAFTLLELLNQHRDCEATDPRDKVFGLLGLSGDVDDIGIFPNYNHSPQEVYTDLFKKHVRSSQTLDMICAVRHPRNFPDLPSWVPDWSTDQLVPPICVNDRYKGGNDFPGSPIAHFKKYAACGTLAPSVSFLGNTLFVKVFKVAKIAFLGNVDDGMMFEDIETSGRADENGKSASDSEIFNQWLNMVLDSEIWDLIAETYRKENVLDAFCRTLVANRNNRMTEPPTYPGSDSDGTEAHAPDSVEMEGVCGVNEPLNDTETTGDQPVMETDEDEASMEVEDHGSSTTSGTILFSPPEMLGMTLDGFRECLQVSWGKRFAILESGHFGIVPGLSMQGDQVVVACGCTMPLVLRATNEQNTTVVGESYIHGIMNGEMLDRATEKVAIE